jgi:hypothetical protein
MASASSARSFFDSKLGLILLDYGAAERRNLHPMEGA